MKNDKGHSCFQKCKLNQLVIFLQVICGTNILVKLLLWKWTYVFLLFLFSIGIYLLYITHTLFQQHKRRLYKWTSPDVQHLNQIDYILCSQNGEALQSQQKQDWELTVAQIMNSLLRLKLKKVEKTTTPFRYDLIQIPYDYTVEVRNRFKGVDLIERVPDELQMEVCDIVQETGIKTIPRKRNAKKQNGCLRRPYKQL